MKDNIRTVRSTATAFVTCFINSDSDGVETLLTEIMDAADQTGPTDLLYGIAELAAGLARGNVFLEAKANGVDLTEEQVNEYAAKGLQRRIAALTLGQPDEQ